MFMELSVPKGLGAWNFNEWISSSEGKHFPIDESKLKNMMEASASRDKEKLFEEPLGFKPDR